MSKTLIQAEHLYRRYGDTLAVQDVSFELRQGDILGLLGPNGAGKSTSMQMLSGALAPTAGRILINGIDLLDQPRAAKRQIGYLPEQPPIYPELSVDEYLSYCARIRRLAGSEIDSALQQAKQRCGLDSNGHRLIGNLSKGYQQRVGIAQAIIHNPAVIILDEPTVGLDPIQIREIRALIAELGEQHGIILSTDILPEVQAICNRVEIINAGRLVYSADMATLNDRLQSNHLLVGFARPPTGEELAAIDGVEQANPLQADRFRLHIDNSKSVAENITRQAVEHNWGLMELTPEKQTLEQVFVELTSTDSEAEARVA
jgi:ABC-2 type transport system ATP-binding protein